MEKSNLFTHSIHGEIVPANTISNINALDHIEGALEILKNKEVSYSLIKNMETISWCNLNKSEALEKLSDIACKIISLNRKGMSWQELFTQVKQAVTANTKISPNVPLPSNIQKVLEALAFLEKALGSRKFEVEDDVQANTLATIWSPLLQESAHRAIEKAQENVISALANIQQLNELLPDFPLIKDTIPDFEKIKSEFEHELSILKNLPKDSSNFLYLLESLQRLSDKRQQIKALGSSTYNSLKQWEESHASLISFDVEGSSEESREFGNKHARLEELSQIISKIILPGVEVPLPHGISSKQVETFLQKTASEVFTEWEELGQYFSTFQKENPCTTPSDFLLLPQVKEKLFRIKLAIEAAFHRASEDQQLFPDSEEMGEWLRTLEQSDRHIMVRSSGAEDSGKTANAGGNVSVAYVKPELKELYIALGAVVSSYFSEGSLKNRLDAQENPFSSAVHLAVTTQELIGEQVSEAVTNPENIPVSAVLFTNEPIFVCKEKFHIMSISATFGHGEGVVGAAGVNSDTFLILRSTKHPERLYILEDLRSKPIRLAPRYDSSTKKTELTKVSNPQELANKPALDHRMLARIFHLGITVENAYKGCPMDMEIVVKDGKIYPVQARPVNRPAAHPSFLNLNTIKTEGHDEVARGVKEQHKIEPFLAGLAEAAIINSAEEILIAENLDHAEKMVKLGKHKLVIIREEEPTNSHPVVNFNGMGIPVMYSENHEKLTELAIKVSKDTPLVACVQTGQLVLLDAQLTKPEEVISEGYTIHPARVIISVNHQKLDTPYISKREIPQEVKNLLMQIRALESRNRGLAALSELKQHGFLSEVGRQRRLLAGRVEKLQRLGRPSVRATQLIHSLESLEGAITRAFSELKATLKADNAERLHPLFHMKVIEALLQQNPSRSGLGSLSVINMEDHLSAARKVLDYEESFNFPPHFSEELLDGACTMTMEQEELWKNFLSNLEHSCESKDLSYEEITKFKENLNHLREMGIMPLWMARFFLPVVGRNELDSKSAAALLRLLNNDFTSESKKIIGDNCNILQEIHSLQDNLDIFADPAKFDIGWKQLKNIQNSLACIPKGLNKQKLDAMIPLGRISTYQVMREYINLFDSAIKQMKASTAYTEKEKVELFSKMLQEYYELLHGLVTLSGSKLEYHHNWPLDKYMNKISEIMKETDMSPDQLRPSGFSVSSAILGPGTAFERSLPKTKEDLFSLIHQNLLVSIQVLLNDEMKDKTVLPPSMQQAMEAVAEVLTAGEVPYYDRMFEMKAAQVEGYTFLADKVIVHYNYPMRNHSATFDLTYDKNSGECVYTGKFVGESRNRWEAIANMERFLDAADELKIDTPPAVKPMEIIYTNKFTKKDECTRICERLKKYAAYTMGVPAGGGVILLPFFPEIIEVIRKMKKTSPEKQTNVLAVAFNGMNSSDIESSFFASSGFANEISKETAYAALMSLLNKGYVGCLFDLICYSKIFDPTVREDINMLTNLVFHITAIKSSSFDWRRDIAKFCYKNGGKEEKEKIEAILLDPNIEEKVKGRVKYIIERSQTFESDFL